jgi:hypothetical protein
MPTSSAPRRRRLSAVFSFLVPATLLVGAARTQQPVVDWVRQFGGGVPKNDVANAVDAQGNVYLAGNTAPDVFVRKCGSGGAEVWTRTFTVTGSQTAITGVAADGLMVVVAGWTTGTLPGQTRAGTEDAFLRAYDLDGNELWTRQFGTVPTERLLGVTMSGGEIYACGHTQGAFPGQTYAGNTDAFVVKYDANGTQIFVRQFGTTAIDMANGVRAAAGVVAVGGQTNGSLDGTSFGGTDAFVRTYDAAGLFGWGAQVGTSGTDVGFAVAVAAGSVCLAGTTRGVLPGQSTAGSQDAFVASFAVAGGLQWLRQFGTASVDSAFAVAADSSGVYVGGSVGNALPGEVRIGGTDAYVRKYDGVGNILWTDQFGTTAADDVLGMAAGPLGVAVCGRTSGTLPGQTTLGLLDAFVRAYDAAGTVTWTQQFGFMVPVQDVGAQAVGGDGSVYVAGSVAGTLPGQPPLNVANGSAFLRKYDAAGTEQWSHQIRTNGGDSIRGLVVLPDGVCVAGTATGSLPGQTNRGAFLRKYDHSGAELWTRQFGLSASDIALAIATDGTNLIVVGRNGSTTGIGGEPKIGTGTNGFVQKCDAAGNPLWTRLIGTSSGFLTEAWAVAVHGGDVYVAGQSHGPLDGEVGFGGTDAFLKKYDAAGVAQWTRLLGATTSTDGAAGVHADASGVYVCGHVNGALPGQTDGGAVDGFVRKYSHAGDELWTRQFGTNSPEAAFAVAGGAGKVYLTGQCGESFGEPHAGGADLFVAEYDAAGTRGWVLQLGTPGDDIARSIAVDDGRIYLGGFTNGALLGQPWEGTQDIFVAALRAGDTVAPIADAGPDQSIHAGNTAFLDGRSSHDETSPTTALSYSWTFSERLAGSSATLAAANSATPSFYADLPGTYRVQLIVTDEADNVSVPDEVVISSLNMAPTANAGLDQLVLVDQAAQLDGLGSFDPDLDPLTWQWTIVAAPGDSAATVAGAGTATPTFTPDLPGTYELQLVVADGFVASAPDTVTLMAVTASDFALMQLRAACDRIGGLTAASFDAPGHQKSLCNLISQITGFIQRQNLAQARAHLSSLVTRVDGWTLRGALDPKGLGQPYEADFVVSEVDQRAVHALLASALAAIST